MHFNLKLQQKSLLQEALKEHRTSLVVQWWRICLPMQGTWVWSWSGKIPHAMRQWNQLTTITEPVLSSPRSPVTEPMHRRAHALQQEGPTTRSWCIAIRKTWVQQGRHSAAKNRAPTNQLNNSSTEGGITHLYTKPILISKGGIGSGRDKQTNQTKRRAQKHPLAYTNMQYVIEMLVQITGGKINFSIHDEEAADYPYSKK